MSQTGDAPSRRAATRWAAVVGALGLLTFGGIWFQHWRTHPDLLHGGQFFSRDPYPLDKADLLVGVTYPPIHGSARWVTFHAAHAHLAAGSAPARVTFWVCTGQSLGSADGTPRHYCNRAQLVRDGVRMAYSPRVSEFLLARIQPLRRGTVRLTAVDLDYTEHRRGPDRRGVQRIDMDARLTAE